MPNQAIKERDSYSDLAEERFHNILKDMPTFGQCMNKTDAKNALKLSDDQFLFDVLTKFIQHKSTQKITLEKKRLLNRAKARVKLFDNINQNGGLLSSAEIASVLGVSKVTVKKRKDSFKLLALEFDGKFFYPSFQIEEDSNSSQSGILKGMEQILVHLSEISDVMRYNFFVDEQKTFRRSLLESDKVRVIDMLKEGVSDELLLEILRLAKLYGTQDAA
jgi:hypothetical protein